MTSPAENDRLVAVARRYFDALAPGAELRTIPLDGGAGVCVVHTARGGGKIYVAPDETALFVGSAMDFDAGLAAFLSGTRTPPEKFSPPKAPAAGPQTKTVDIEGARVGGRAAGELAAQLEGVIGAFTPYRAEFRDGFSLQLGWGTLTLRRDADDAYTLVAPRYDLDPVQGVTDDLTVTLWALVGLSLVASKTSAESVPTRYDQDVIVANRALDAPRWTMNRTAPRTNDSGWYFDVYPTPAGPDLAPNEMTRYPAARLLGLKKHAVRALFLPPGVGAVVDDGGVQVIFWESDMTVLAPGPL
jgi:hypothetical protein